MSDPIQDLENFNSEGLPVNPLSPSEVRRLGDRMRRRRNAAAVVAGVAAVAVIAAPIALFAGRDGSSSPDPAPAPPTTSPTGSPDVVETTSPTPEPIVSWFGEIPDDFPLAAGWPDDDQAESEDEGLTGPNRRLDSLLFTACGHTLDDTVYVDRLRADWTNPEDYRNRQLTTYADADQAVEAVRALTEFHRSCPTEELGDGYTRVREVRRTQVGGESWAVVSHLEFASAPAISIHIIHVIRLGRAVLIDTVANEGMLQQAESQLDFMTSDTSEPVTRMCVFTNAGCTDGTEPIEAPVVGTLLPEGFDGVLLGMTLEEAKAAGAHVISADPGACTLITIPSSPSTSGIRAWVSQERGVVGIFGKLGVSTMDGIGFGSTLAEVQTAYPGTDTSGEYTVLSPVPGHDDRQYATQYDEEDRVVSLVLQLKNPECCN
jgi:hypothetical protein